LDPLSSKSGVHIIIKFLSKYLKPLLVLAHFSYKKKNPLSYIFNAETEATINEIKSTLLEKQLARRTITKLR
jgi:hypothetical protein